MSKVNHCIVCEGLRPEVGGKSTIVGFVGVLPNVKIWIGNLDAPIPQLTFVFIFAPEKTHLQIRPQIISPEGKPILPIEHTATIELFDAYASNVVINMGGFSFPQAGEYTVQLYSDEAIIFSEKMTVQEGSAPPSHEPRYIGEERLINKLPANS